MPGVDGVPRASAGSLLQPHRLEGAQSTFLLVYLMYLSSTYLNRTEIYLFFK